MSIVWQLVGWAGNACFFSRFLVQWLASERACKTVAPRSFWWLSLGGSSALSVYTLQRGQPILLVGLLTNGAIYVRNLWMDRRSRDSRPMGIASRISLALPAAALLALAAWIATGRMAPTTSPGWLVCVAVGQVLWTSRFLVQWWASEQEGRSHFPRSFWGLSLCGNVLLLAYTIHLQDAVLIAGYTPGPVVQIRNLILSRRKGNTPLAR